MPLRESIALTLFALPIVGLAALWVLMVRRAVTKHRTDARRRAEALARPLAADIAIGMSRGGFEFFLLVATVPVAFFVWPFWFVSSNPVSPLWLLGAYAISVWLTCGGLWRYIRPSGKAPVLWLSAEGLQFLSRTRILWSAVAAADLRVVRGYRSERAQLVLTLCDGADVSTPREGALFLRRWTERSTQKGKIQVLLDITNLEEWATYATVLALVNQRLNAAHGS